MGVIPAGETEWLIDGPAGKIEVITMQPKTGEANDLAIICHPHSQMGGSMHNKVVHTVARTHRDAGHLSVRFNFRSVGKSSGDFDEGRGESDDLLSVLRWGREQCPQGRLFLAGFSFGSFVLARSAEVIANAGIDIAHLLLIAPPVHHFEFNQITSFPAPLTVIMGEADEVVPPDDVYAWFETVTTKKQLIKVPEAGHFFHGRLNELKQWVHNDIV